MVVHCFLSLEDNEDKVRNLTAGLNRCQSLRFLSESILDQVLSTLDSTAVQARTKALRALTSIVAVEPELFSQVSGYSWSGIEFIASNDETGQCETQYRKPRQRPFPCCSRCCCRTSGKIYFSGKDSGCSILAVDSRTHCCKPNWCIQLFDNLRRHFVKQDTGLGVRKRVIKLLKTLYLLLDDIESRTDISRRLLGRLADEDDAVKV
jgi:hypothetical protein